MKASGEPLAPLKFSPSIGRDFSSTLKKRVRAYFKENELSKYANNDMVFKTIFMVLLYFTPYTLMMTGVIGGAWGRFTLLCNYGVWDCWYRPFDHA